MPAVSLLAGHEPDHVGVGELRLHGDRTLGLMGWLRRLRLRLVLRGRIPFGRGGRIRELHGVADVASRLGPPPAVEA